MKVPNVASLVALLLVVLPAVSVGIEQVFPAAEWYWSPLVVTLLGVVAKVLQESLGSGSASVPLAVQPESLGSASGSASVPLAAAAPNASETLAIPVQPSLVRRVLLG